MAIYESGDRIEYGPTSYEKAVQEEQRAAHIAELEAEVARLKGDTMPEDWGGWLTEKEREWNADLNDEVAYSRTEDQGGLNRPNDRLIQLQGALCTVAALRALVEELKRAGQNLADHIHFTMDANCGKADSMLKLLALTEEDMLKRMEGK